MNLQEIWLKLEKERLVKPVTESMSLPGKSIHPVNKLTQGFARSLGFIAIFGLIYIYLLIIVTQPIVKIVMAIIVLAHVIFFILGYRALGKMRTANKLDRSTYQSVKDVYSIVTRTLAFQLKVSWGFFPLSIIAGFVLGLSLQTDLAYMLSQPKILVLLLIIMIVITPLCFVLTKAMNKIAYGKYLDQLKGLLHQIEEVH